jgi:hypothetical protein
VVPVAYHTFFEGCASVAGTLIGLLFVAISVSPEKLTGDNGTVEHRIRAAAAFSALSNALVIALFALLPTTNLGIVALPVSIVGLSSTAGLFAMQMRERGEVRNRAYVLMILLLVVYGFELVNAIRLVGNSRTSGAVYDLAVIVVVCFLIGIARAWELLGAGETGVIGLISRLTNREHPPSSE